MRYVVAAWREIIFDDVAEISSRRRPKTLTNFSILSNSRTFPTWYQKKVIANGRETKRLQLSFVAIQVTFFSFYHHVRHSHEKVVRNDSFIHERKGVSSSGGFVFVPSSVALLLESYYCISQLLILLWYDESLLCQKVDHTRRVPRDCSCYRKFVMERDKWWKVSSALLRTFATQGFLEFMKFCHTLIKKWKYGRQLEESLAFQSTSCSFLCHFFQKKSTFLKFWGIKAKKCWTKDNSRFDGTP